MNINSLKIKERDGLFIMKNNIAEPEYEKNELEKSELENNENRKNKVVVQICDKEYTLLTEEQESYVKEIAAEVTGMIDATAYKNLRTSKLDAAMITCLDLCDKLHKMSRDNDNMRREIVGYIDDIGKLSKKLSAYERQKSGRRQDEQEERPNVSSAIQKFIGNNSENIDNSAVEDEE